MIILQVELKNLVRSKFPSEGLMGVLDKSICHMIITFDL